jgi:transcriptional regulator with XRE-family HTH domain
MSCFGERLRIVAMSADMSQAELARAAGTYPANMSQWINGTTSPTATSLGKLLRALPHADARWLLTGETRYTITDAGRDHLEVVRGKVGE